MVQRVHTYVTVRSVKTLAFLDRSVVVWRCVYPYSTRTGTGTYPRACHRCPLLRRAFVAYLRARSSTSTFAPYSGGRQPLSGLTEHRPKRRGHATAKKKVKSRRNTVLPVARVSSSSGFSTSFYCICASTTTNTTQQRRHIIQITRDFPSNTKKMSVQPSLDQIRMILSHTLSPQADIRRVGELN